MLHSNRDPSSNATRNSPWIVRRTPRDKAALRIFCFPHAGAGSVIFKDWFDDFPPSVDVCAIEPPGRFVRHREPLLGDMTEFVNALEPVLDPFLDLPYALFGYSLGALMAFETGRAIRRRRKLSPTHLVVAAAKAPQLPARLAPISREPKQALVQELERRYGALEPVIKQDPELFELALKIMRADLGLLEAYRYRDEPAFDCPILALGGSSDPSILPAEVEGWRAQTTGPFRCEWLQGSHFFLRTSGSQLRALVIREVVPSA